MDSTNANLCAVYNVIYSTSEGVDKTAPANSENA